MATLVLVCGLPGSGRTTLARTLAAERRALRLCPQDWPARLGLDPHDEALLARIEALQWEQALDVLRAGASVVAELGLWTRWEREKHRVAATQVGARVELHALDVPLEVRWARLQHHPGAGGVPVTREQLEAHQRAWEPPTAGELALYDGPEDA